MPVKRENVYQERLWAPWWVWLASGVAPLTLGVAYGSAITALVGWAVGLVLTLFVGVTLIRTAPTIRVTDDGVWAKRVFLPRQFIGDVTPLDSNAAQLLRGVHANGRAFMVLRGWVDTAVRMDVDDQLDPTPYWYMSTRRPLDLAERLRSIHAAR